MNQVPLLDTKVLGILNLHIIDFHTNFSILSVVIVVNGLTSIHFEKQLTTTNKNFSWPKDGEKVEKIISLFGKMSCGGDEMKCYRQAVAYFGKCLTFWAFANIILCIFLVINQKYSLRITF